MALYSAKEAKWYRRNVERREHCQFNSPFCFIKFPVFVFRCLSFVTIVRRIDRYIRKLESFFLSTAPLPRSTPYRKSGLITSRAARARRCKGIKRTSQAITSTESITRHDRALGKNSRTRN